MYAQYYLLTFDRMHLLRDTIPVIDYPDESLAQTAFTKWRQCVEADSELEAGEFTVFDKIGGAMTLDVWKRSDKEPPRDDDEEDFP